jgi:hypothetical protein
MIYLESLRYTSCKQLHFSLSISSYQTTCNEWLIADK